jgi:retinol dehydrogenase-12
MGSRTLIAGTLAGEESHGMYMSDCRVQEPSDFVRSDEGMKTQKEVYRQLLEILEELQPGITSNI